MSRLRLAAALLALTPLAALAQDRALTLKRIGAVPTTGDFDAGAAEIPAYDPVSRRLFVVNAAASTIDVIDLSNPAQPQRLTPISVAPFGAQANSVDVSNGLLAAAIEAPVKQDPGVVVFFNTQTLAPLSTVTVGALPDMVHFTANGTYAVVANEGEPNADYSVDPEGSVSVITVGNGTAPTVATASFARFNDQADALRAARVRLFGPGASVAQDLEPEYVASEPNERLAYVTLQENNAMAEIDLANARVREIRALGFKDHSQPGRGLDPSDRDGGIRIGNWPVLGWYMPDSVSLYRSGGESFLVMANEGDARDYDTFSEEARVKDLALNPATFPNAAALQADAAIGRLNVTTVNGDDDGDGQYERLYAFGARSFSIRRTDASLVWDSGDQLEQITAAANPRFFNADNTENNFDNRSDNKGPEPEGLALGRIAGRHYAFVGLERAGGVVVYDITDPTAPRFQHYLNPRDFSVDAETQLAEVGDLGPEGLIFIPRDESPNGRDLLVVANEISGSTSIYQVQISNR